MPDGPEIPARDARFPDLYTDLAWLHGYDAHTPIAATESAGHR